MIRRTVAAAACGVVAALGSALCCAGPLVAVALGLSGAGLASMFEPLRPYFVGAAAVGLGAGFWVLHREERNACVPGKPCADLRTRGRLRRLLWTATVLAALLVTFPSWSSFVL